MTGPENILARLETLVSRGTLARSGCSSQLLRVLQPLIQAGVIAEERSGAGRSLVVRDPAALLRFKAQQFPNSDITGLGTRVSGVGRFRDSKSLRADTPEIISVRCWDDHALGSRGTPVGAAAATARFGVFSFVLNPGTDLSLSGLCAVVENPAVFLQFERLGLGAGLVIHGHGRLSNRALNWLKRAGENATILHLPDYDPAGLSEHLRLREALGKRTKLHVPADLESRFEHFSNRALLNATNTQSLLAQLRKCPIPEIKRIVDLIHKHNAGLEQEALLLT